MKIGFSAIPYGTSDPILNVLGKGCYPQKLRIVIDGLPNEPIEPSDFRPIFDEALKLELVPLSISQGKNYVLFETLYPNMEVVRSENPYVLEKELEYNI